MYNSHVETSVVLVGERLWKMPRLVETLNSAGIVILFAENSADAMRTICFEGPDFLISDMELPDGSGAGLCRSLRENKQLPNIPVFLASETERSVSGMVDALSSGADDLLEAGFDPKQFLAKVVWLIDRRNSEAAREQHFESLRQQQTETLNIVRETSALFGTLADERRHRAANSHTPEAAAFPLEHRIELGMQMIDGLASLLDEQVRALALWEDPAEIPARSCSYEHTFADHTLRPHLSLA
ncbi:MAG TPA: response regulator [Pyrinomonadaceae bacterium]|nr:response regulator [Pyrinomonadaceae bacterium]